ncbi:MAG: hypothetical protein AB7K68_13200 [Bacteriovoracia bacterium]
MSADSLPEDVKKFITLYIESVEQILVLQILFENPERAWTIPELTLELRSANSSIERRLNNFYSSGVLWPPAKEGDKIIFSPKGNEMEKSIRLLIKAFRERPSTTVEMIYSRPAQAIQAFADAFKIRKDEK